jgi:hypothetical protein
LSPVALAQVVSMPVALVVTPARRRAEVQEGCRPQ